MGKLGAGSLLAGRSSEANPNDVPRGRSLGSFLGPALLVSVGYMDPGNWATDIEGGVRFGYGLLWVLVLSNAIAWLLQTLSARLGAVSGLDLASACRVYYSRGAAVWLWILAEIAIMACDLAELLGSAVALNLLFGLPLLFGAVLTVLDVFVILELQRRARLLERVVGILLLTIAVCLGFELVLAQPRWVDVAPGLVPRLTGESLYLAIGILGATVMPHNLYLHSALVPRSPAATTSAQQVRHLRSGMLSTGVALNAALLVNAAILILAAAVFSTRGVRIADLGAAHRLLAPLLGSGVASLLFALGLLCSGQTSTLTGTLAGQVVMEGFLCWNVSPVVRRLVTRSLALVPALWVMTVAGPGGIMPLLVVSQVVLSLQLPFAIVPLLRFTNSPHIMGGFANSPGVRLAAGAAALLIVAVNVALVLRTTREWHEASPGAAYVFASLALLALVFLAWIARVPLRRAPEQAVLAYARQVAQESTAA